jgi:hypothetical protein
MKAHQLEPGKCYIQRDRDGDGGTIFEVKNVSCNDFSVLIEYRKMFDFTADLGRIVTELDFQYYADWNDDGFEPCDVTLLDKIVKLYDIFRASAKPLIKQALNNQKQL